MSRSVIATYVIPFWFSTEKSYLLRVRVSYCRLPIIVEVMFRLRGELGQQTLSDLSEVSSGLLIRSTENLLTKNNIPRA